MNQSNHSLQAARGKRLGIGVDYGTSNSAAAIFDGETLRVIKLEDNSLVMPSATYINRDYQIVTGQEAIEEYVRSNTGRTVELSAEILGEGRTSTGQIGDHGLPEEASTSLIYGQSLVDGGQQGRLFRGVKRLRCYPTSVLPRGKVAPVVRRRQAIDRRLARWRLPRGGRGRQFPRC